MKAYGFSRSDKQSCRWGCCTTSKGKMNNFRAKIDRAKKKSARQLNNKLCGQSGDHQGS